MTDKTPTKKRRKFSAEILGIAAVCLLIAFCLFQFLLVASTAVVQNYCDVSGIPVTEDMQYSIDSLTFSLSTALSALVFAILFLVLIGERLSYVQTLILGVETLKEGNLGSKVALEGNNELTELGEAINFLSDAQLEVKEREGALAKEKEDFIRAISHDIRTPLTAILSYSELMESGTADPMECARVVKAKAMQIKELSDILLDGSKRNLEIFEDGELLIKQLAEEFADGLEGEFNLEISTEGCKDFCAMADVSEMQRIFDNLSSNVKKYASRSSPVIMNIKVDEGGLTIEESNAVNEDADSTDGYRMGIGSIRRIAESYGGSVEVISNDSTFRITVTLPQFSNL